MPDIKDTLSSSMTNSVRCETITPTHENPQRLRLRKQGRLGRRRRRSIQLKNVRAYGADPTKLFSS